MGSVPGDLAQSVAASGSARRYGFDERTVKRIAHLLEHFTGGPPAGRSPVKAQLDALGDALDAVNAAWWSVVRTPQAFNAVAEHYCEEAANRAECLRRLQAALNLEPVRFAVRMARRQPWHAVERYRPPAESGQREAPDPRRLVLRLHEMTRGLPGPTNSVERRQIVSEMLALIGIDIDPEMLEEMIAAGYRHEP